MNILLAFKAEPDAGMLAEKEWQAAAQGKSGPDISLLRSLLGADEQAAAALLLAQRKNGTPMSLTALSMGDDPAGLAFTWCKHLPGDFVRYSNRKRAQIPLGKCANGDAANRKTPAMPFPGASGGSSEKRHVALWNATTEHCPGCASGLAG
ncbi:flavoprotein [Escherichia coli]|nr:flavoprotein [Escherichia coli]